MAGEKKNLSQARYVNLSTFRSDGREVTTPVWFTLYRRKLYVLTTESTGKVKRLRNDSRVRFAVCDSRGRENLGPVHEGAAALAGDPVLIRNVERMLGRKYIGWFQLFRLIYALRGWRRVFLEITYRPD